jgi:DNA (cytosine-5)-methyltransferase 1
VRVVGLFAGIGGLEIGLAQARHETVLMAEILPAARAVLSHHFPHIELQGDVQELRDLPKGIDLIAAGFPCQDLSQAGLTRGLDGSRSGLVGEVFRLASIARPKWILLENVPFMLQLRSGDAMRRIIAMLEELGYLWAWRVVDTFGFGLPHRRERVFLLASRDGDPATVLLAEDSPLERPKTALGKIAHGFYWTEGRGGLGWAPDAVPTLKNGSTIGIPSPPAVLLPDGRIVKPDIRDAERLQGFEENWTAPAENIVRSGFRWGLVGSAVSVPVSKWVGERLAQPGKYDRLRDGAFPNQGRLPRAARFDGVRRHAVDVGTDPLGIQPKPLAEFLMHSGAPLSVRATAGFLSRTRVATLRFPDGFIHAVEAHLGSVERVDPRYQILENCVA